MGGMGHQKSIDTESMRDSFTVSQAHLSELSSEQFFQIAQARQEVFVLEQQCIYLDLDVDDTAASTWHVWISSGEQLCSYARCLLPAQASEPARIGRVLTRRPWRGRGLAQQLLNHCLAILGNGPIELSAQTYLTNWYKRFGFVQTGPEFLDTGIAHVPMRRDSPDTEPNSTRD